MMGSIGEETEKIRCYFDEVASRYDFMNTLLSFGIHHIWKRTAVRKLELKSGDRIIDICGGTGDLATLASSETGAADRIAIYDLNRLMMVTGRKKRAGVPGNTVSYVQGNAEIISFHDNTFDAVMIGFGIRNVVDMLKGLKEIYRVLKPGGRMMCLEFSTPGNSVFKWLYDFYSFYFIPVIGKIITGSIQAYTHLPVSIRKFPQPDQFSDILKDIGFSDVSYQKLTHGIAVIHMGKK